MKSVTIKINTKNDAFQGNPDAEVIRILRQIIKHIENNVPVYDLMDANGNKVGTIKFT